MLALDVQILPHRGRRAAVLLRSRHRHEQNAEEIRGRIARSVNNAEYNIAVVVILGLDTATRQGSVAVLVNGRVHASIGDPSRSHGQRLPTELLDCLAHEERRLEEVDLFAVIAGPGSFTGLRVGMATVQGLAMTTGRPVMQVPTLDAMRFSWLRYSPNESRIVVPCLDGQRGEVFFSAHRPGDDGALLPPGVARPEDAARLLAGYPPASLVLLGDGAARYRQVLASQLPGAEIAELPGTLAEAAVRMAADRPDRAGPPHALRPVYVRKPDAELARARSQSRADTQAISQLPAGFTVVQAQTAREIAAVEALQRRSFTNAWGIEAIRWELENTDVARLYVLRNPAGDVVAYCACWLIFDELHINSLAVADEMRRRGLAAALLRAVMRNAHASGARSATLEVRRSNDAALALYEKLGFRVEAVRREYYQDPREDALVLWHRRLDDFG
jgi:tRNA threonylcarbamoyl adenosine modification protein YeaZ/ribosomal-protein-alanine acetyltransferase